MAASVPEVSVINVDYWAAHAVQLAVLLVGTASASVIPDPAGLSPDPNRMVTVTDPAYWASDPRTLEDALANLATGQAPGGAQESVGRAAGAVGQTPDRLTLTVEEAAATLGISRAFATSAAAASRSTQQAQAGMPRRLPPSAVPTRGWAGCMERPSTPPGSSTPPMMAPTPSTPGVRFGKVTADGAVTPSDPAATVAVMVWVLVKLSAMNVARRRAM